MTPEEFVDCFAREKESLLRLWLEDSESEVACRIAELGLAPDKVPLLREVLDLALTDAFYTVLLGLDGEAAIGGRQEDYRLCDSEGNLLSGGEIEVHAWERFQARFAETNR